MHREHIIGCPSLRSGDSAQCQCPPPLPISLRSVDDHIIIVEGSDKCGKTSLCLELARRLGLPVVKFSQPTTPEPCDEYLRALANRAGGFVADRFHLGEFVYGPIYRDTFPPTYKMQEVEDQLIRRRALLVLMWDYGDAVAERFARHNETYAKASHIPGILQMFDEAWQSSRVAKVRLRWSADPAVQNALVDRVAYLAGR